MTFVLSEYVLARCVSDVWTWLLLKTFVVQCTLFFLFCEIRTIKFVGNVGCTVFVITTGHSTNKNSQGGTIVEVYSSGWQCFTSNHGRQAAVYQANATNIFLQYALRETECKAKCQINSGCDNNLLATGTYSNASNGSLRRVFVADIRYMEKYSESGSIEENTMYIRERKSVCGFT